MRDAYVKGFVDKCAEYGVDPNALAKQAKLSDFFQGAQGTYLAAGITPESPSMRSKKDIAATTLRTEKDPSGSYRITNVPPAKSVK